MRIHVAAAVIRDAQGQVLIAQRSPDKHQGGLWEFPGGKVEPGESVAQALARELHEELGIAVQQARPLIQVAHDYADKQVLLDVWEVSAFSGQAQGIEGQPLRWVPAETLPDYAFPAANLPIVAAARLPDCYLITPPNLSSAALLQGIQRALQQGTRLILLRAPQLTEQAYRDLLAQLLPLCAGRAQLMAKGELARLEAFPEVGWHLDARQLHVLAGQARPLPAGRWLAASCHDPQELAMAEALGVDFLTLSPVLPTTSHPGQSGLGWETVRDCLAVCRCPAYLLGGLGRQHLAQAWQAGAQGVAGISQLWPT